MYIGDWYGVYSAPTSGKTPGGRLEGGMFIFEKGKNQEKNNMKYCKMIVINKLV
ncbi:hypothetical protein Ga0061079_10440 [Apibacter mensalis]|uniref:Uncharacterized protein n=1 Tax=Apibacter mensalis TaxID=1586267 RepID=A0A0X3ANJ5_9FLAO|nr:hypothetical protein [Apibacter mensalis]CVK15922.1 hypothetical protein Ga0061079_10440 [Apibacter mensalis]